MVSWFVKQALLNLAKDINIEHDVPKSRNDWELLMNQVGVKGIHIAERDTQRASSEKPMNIFVNAWSVEGFVSEGLQPAELGWGTHEKWMPENGRTHEKGCQAAIYLLQPGGRYMCAVVDPDRRGSTRLPRDAQRVDLHCGLLYRPRGRQDCLPSDLPLRVSPLQRGGAVPAQDVQ